MTVDMKENNKKAFKYIYTQNQIKKPFLIYNKILYCLIKKGSYYTINF